MERTPINTPEEARQKAKDWQQWQAEQQLSWKELLEWEAYFDALAEGFDLVEEFKEEGII